MVDFGGAAPPGVNVAVAAEDLHMSAVPKRVVQLAGIIAVRVLSLTVIFVGSEICFVASQWLQQNKFICTSKIYALLKDVACIADVCGHSAVQSSISDHDV
jgi:hypothetical protein